MKRSGVAAAVIILFLVTFLAGPASADDANVLPKGVWSVSVDTKQYLPITKQFNSDGGVESAAADFNADLNSNVFTSLGLIEQALGLPPGSTSLGTSVVDFRFTSTQVETTVAYGITDKLSVGVIVPYIWVSNDVNVRVDNTTVSPVLLGVNTNFATDANPINQLPFLPAGTPGVRAFTTEDAQALISTGLVVNGVNLGGLGFKRLESWSHNGLGDIQAGLKYKYYQSENWRLAGRLAAVFPTGYTDDPDNLADRDVGNGCFSLKFQSSNDYTGVNRLRLNVAAEYLLTFPKDVTLRVVDDPHQPLSGSNQNVDRNRGDSVELTGTAEYQVFEGGKLFGTYKYGRGWKDTVEGPNGRIPSLEEETDYYEQVYYIGATYSTIPLFVQKKFPLPMTLGINYRNRFAGNNGLFKSQYVEFGVQVYF